MVESWTALTCCASLTHVPPPLSPVRHLRPQLCRHGQGLQIHLPDRRRRRVSPLVSFLICFVATLLVLKLTPVFTNPPVDIVLVVFHFAGKPWNSLLPPALPLSYYRNFLNSGIKTPLEPKINNTFDVFSALSFMFSSIFCVLILAFSCVIKNIIKDNTSLTQSLTSRCPVEPSIFPQFKKDGYALQSVYEAFRFTESYGVIFQCNVKYCLGPCEPVSDGGEEGRLAETRLEGL